MAHQSYDELEWHLRRLRNARKAGKLVFLLGAGINTEYGLPDWGQMLVRLMQRCGRLSPSAIPTSAFEMKQLIDAVVADPLMQAAAIRGAYVNSAEWLRALRHVLAVREEQLDDQNKPLGRIAKIVAAQYTHHKTHHIAILTFNFDDLMERALARELGSETARDVVTSVATATEMARARRRPGIYVYHLHGSLTNEQSEIVLEAQSFVRILAAPANHWSWACMNAFLFQQDSGVMFIGLSLLDPSLRLLLTQSATNGMPLSAVFVAKPLNPPLIRDADNALDLPRSLRAAMMMHDVRILYDDLLEELSLIPYHVTAWSEINSLLERMEEND